MDTQELFRNIAMVVLMVLLLCSSQGHADEILFKDQGVQIGTVLKIDEQTVTVRFPRDSITSIVRDQEGVSSRDKTRAPETVSAESQFQKKIERLQKRLERLEKGQDEDKKSRDAAAPDPSKNAAAIEQLLQEEMGRVQGVILWKGKPLANRSVKIVLTKYTGFSPAAIKRMFSGNKEKSSGQEIVLSTPTDSQGKYVFEQVPPGQYRLFWMPDTKTGWVHRMREKPDFEVISGKLTIQNIPEKKK